MGGTDGYSRREAVALLGTAVASAGCVGSDLGSDASSVSDTATPAEPRNVVQGQPDESLSLVADRGEVRPGPAVTTEMDLYDDQYPAPTLRVAEGAAVEATVLNRLDTPTTVHWHGLPVPNWMDGVPGVTQGPVLGDDAFTYEFVAEPAGTYLYHSHVGLQLDWTLVGVLVVEDPSPHVDYDREYVVFLDDLLTHRPPQTQFPSVPDYLGLTMNGALPASKPRFSVRDGERIRFRLVNGAAATTFRLQLAGHEMAVTHKDGRPVEPATTDAVELSMAERYDVVVTADDPGQWELRATPVNGDDIGNPPPAVGVVEYGAATGDDLQTPSQTDGVLDDSSLSAVEAYDGVGGTPDRRYRLRLDRGPEPGSWAINDQVYPDADWLDVRPNEHVRFVMRNESEMIHPMHLHGHFFVADGVIMDTVKVYPGETQVIDFYTDNPGRWFFHCHNEYHLASGMARVVRYLD